MGERQQQRCAAGRRDFDDIAGAEIMDRDDAAERFVGRVDRSEPDQVGVVIFILVGGRQFFARDVEFDAVEALGVLAGCDAFQRRDQMAFCLARGRDLKGTRAVLGHQRSVSLHRQRVFGKSPELYRAAHAMRGADPGDADLCRHRRAPSAYFLAAAAAAAAAVLAAAAEAVAAVAAASALALRSLRGNARSGLLRAGRFATPAASRKRKTRSDGCAPLPSQALTLSMSSFSRASLSFGSSGLKWPSRSMKRPSRGKRESATTT